VRLRARRAIVIALGLASPPALSAQTQVVVPNVYTNTGATAVSAVPIHIQNNPWTFQLIYHESQLTGLIGKDLTAISYRRGATEGGGYPLQTTTWSNYVVRLGPSVAPSSATGTFANNFTAAPTLVNSGPWTVPFLAWQNFGPPGPNPWGPALAFDTPYHYTGGHLAMLITHPGSDNPFIGNALIDSAGSTSPGQGIDFTYRASTGFDAASGSASVFMPVVQFTAVQPVPEPTTCLLGGAAVLAAGAAVRRLRRREPPAPLASDGGSQ
jgi:hypothetical protein